MSESSLPRAGALGVVLLMACLAPVAFWGGGLEAFESAKSSLLLLGGIALAGLGALACRSVPRVPRDPVTLAVGAGLAAACVATLGSVAPRLSLLGAHESHAGLLALAALAAAYLATRTAVASRRQAEALVAGLSVACALAAGYALVQTVGLDPLRWDERSDFAGWFRPSSTEGHPIKLAGLLVMALPLILWRGKAVGALLALACAAAVVACLARGAWLAGVVGLAVWLCLRPGAGRLPWRWLFLGACAIAAVVWLTGLAGPLAQRALGMGEGRTRFLIWESCWRLFLERPLAGWGPDTLHLAFGRQRIPEYWELEWARTPTRAHNEFLHVLATQGLLGGLAFLAMLAALARAAVVAWQRCPQDRGLVAALAASVAAHQTAMLTGFSSVGSAVLFAIAAGLLARLSAGPLDDGPALAGGRILLATGAAAGWLLLVANAVLFAARPLGWVDAVVLAALGGLPALLAGRAEAALGLSPTASPMPTSFGKPQPDLRVPVAAVACLCAYLVVVRPLAAWSLCRRAELRVSAAPAQRMEWLEEAVRWCPERDEVWHRLAMGAQDAATKGDRPEARLRRALAAAEEVVRLLPASSEAQANRGKALLELARAGLADADAVCRAYERAAALDPANPVHLRDAARACLALGEPTWAERWIARAEGAGVRNGSIGAERAALHLARGDAARAHEAIVAALTSAPWGGDAEELDRARGLLCLARLETGQHAAAWELAREIGSTRTDWPILACIQGMALERMGRAGEAADAYRRAAGHPHAEAGLRRLRTAR